MKWTEIIFQKEVAPGFVDLARKSKDGIFATKLPRHGPAISP